MSFLINTNNTRPTTNLHKEKNTPAPNTLDADPHPLEMYPDLLDLAAEEIHHAWMERTPQTQENQNRYLPYKKLPETEKQRERQRLLIASELLEKTPLPRNPEEVAQTLGCRQHEWWRLNGPKPNGVENRNVPWENLDTSWKREYLAAGRATLAALQNLNTAIGESLIQALGKRFLACN
jgi:hypothetical protein